jgi:3-oxoacyl-(acyl-carrier-protein) synthase
LITAPKSALGESFSSSGGFQIATALMSMNTGMVPPTINTKNSEKKIQNVLLKTSVKKEIRHALITAFSPMCQQSICVIKNNND